MLFIAAKSGDVMSRFNLALMLGNVEERVKIMAEMGQVPLALLTAKTHDLQEFVPKLEEQLHSNDVAAHIPPNARLLLPPVPLIRPSDGDSPNWPLLMSIKDIFLKNAYEGQVASTLPEEQPFDVDQEEVPEDTERNIGAWGDEEGLDLGTPAGGDWGMDLDLGIEAADLPVQEAHVEAAGLHVTMADSAQTKWLKKRKLAADLVAAGEFEEALGLLRRRLGIINADPLEPLFKDMYWATCSSLPGPPQGLSLMWPMLSEGNLKSKEVQPVILYTMQKILERVKEGHKLTFQGKFTDALTVFRSTLQAITLSVANDQREEQQLLEMIDICREYVNLCRLEVARKGMDQTSTARMIELAAYMTCCKVQPVHLMLTLQLAMTISFKAGNYVTAASFAKRMIQGNFSNERNKEAITKARQLVTVCEQRASDAHSLKFDIKAPPESFKLCSGSLAPIAATDPTTSCPYCGASYTMQYKGKLCDTCQLSEVGLNALGIQLRPI